MGHLFVFITIALPMLDNFPPKSKRYTEFNVSGS